MAYEFIKQRGRVAFFKDGVFDHQQFPPHRGWRDPAGYIAEMEARDREDAEWAELAREARLESLRAYLAARAARRAASPELPF